MCNVVPLVLSMFNLFMKRNFLPQSFLLHWKDQLNSQYNFCDRRFVTALLFEILNFICFENNTTSGVIVHNHCQKSCIYLKSTQDITQGQHALLPSTSSCPVYFESYRALRLFSTVTFPRI